MDNFAQHKDLLEKINEHYRQWQSIHTELNQLNGQAKSRDHERSLLHYQYE
ncbi:hypothetical protein [Coxiella-like endosymbiont]|uniref:hypothetical protein n=1 Tax=Coxiella-like endosymbiont TaxID=1592897 RepID=UPI00272D7488|nr:hypothetical protein [Coxiella-like endosymbiont]